MSKGVVNRRDKFIWDNSFKPDGQNGGGSGGGISYSTEEQVVGTWIDGKPLYQKMFILDSDVNISNSSWTSISLYGSNIKLIIEAKCLSSGFALYPLNAYVDRADFKFMSCRDGNPATCKYLMLQYTKTTD